jgi:hypothetical protein
MLKQLISEKKRQVKATDFRKNDKLKQLISEKKRQVKATDFRKTDRPQSN